MGGKDDQHNHTSDRYVYFFGDDTSDDTDTDTSRSRHRRRKLEDTEAELKRRREKLNNDIAKKLGIDTDGRNPLNVAIVGAYGVGKSSTINTLMTAMTNDTFREYAMSGSFRGVGRQMTYLANSFPKKAYREPVHPDACLPTIIDIAGFNDENTDLNKELLRIVFYGRLPARDSLKKAEKVYKDKGIEGLRDKYSQNLELLKVDRIIFVASARETIPENLISCVMDAASSAGAKAGKGKMTIPVFGILTKIDGVDLESSEFKDRENIFLECLGLVGAKQRYARLVNYCSHVDVDDERLEKHLPKIDVPALKFLRQVLDPVYEVQASGETFTDTCPAAPTVAPQSPGAGPVEPNTSPLTRLVTYALKGIIIALFACVCLAPSIFSYDLLSICKYYNQNRFRSTIYIYEDDHVTNFCNRMDVIGILFMGPLLFFVVLMSFLLQTFAKILKGIIIALFVYVFLAPSIFIIMCTYYDQYMVRTSICNRMDVIGILVMGPLLFFVLMYFILQTFAKILKGIIIALFVYVCLAPCIFIIMCTYYNQYMFRTSICNRMDVIVILVMGPLLFFVVLMYFLLQTFAKILKGIIIALFVYFCLAPSIFSFNFSSMCTHYDQHRFHSTTGYEDPVTKICNRKMNIIGILVMGPLLFFVVLMYFLLQTFAKILKKTKKD